MKKMIKTWLIAGNAWIHWGVDSQLEYTLKRKILHTNIAAIIAVISMLNFFAVSWSVGSSAMLRVVFAQSPFLATLLMIPWFNRKGWCHFARWDLAFSVIVSQLLAILMAFGSFLSVHYYFLLFAILPIAFFPRQQWWALIFLFVLNLWLFLTFEHHWYPPDPAIFNMDSSVTQRLRNGYLTTTFLTILFFVCMMELIAEKNEKKLESLSVTDMLTSLPNRRFFEIAFNHERATSRRAHTPLALIMLDIDNFKQINDKFGHGEGDNVLKHVAICMKRASRAANVIARVGGEEFSVLLPNTTLAEAVEVAERIRSAVESSDYSCRDEKIKLTVSLGVCAVDCSLPLDHSYRAADKALYAAKNSGRNRVVCMDRSA